MGITQQRIVHGQPFLWQARPTIDDHSLRAWFSVSNKHPRGKLQGIKVTSLASHCSAMASLQAAGN